MNPEKLIRMANQIATFFESMPDRPQAIADTASHIRRSWDPRMRRALLDHVERHGMADLRPFLAEALRTHGRMLRPET